MVHERSAIALDEQTAIFSIEYSGKFTDRDAFYPTETGDTSLVHETDPGILYAVLDGTTVITPERSRGFVISEARAIDNEFYRKRAVRR